MSKKLIHFSGNGKEVRREFSFWVDRQCERIIQGEQSILTDFMRETTNQESHRDEC